jgi:uncharacterized UPF0160 family protein
MEVLRSLIKEANMLFNTADHLTYVTYPTVKENKLMVTIIENLYNSLVKGMDAILYYDRMYKRISPFSDNFNVRLEVFKTKCAPRYNIDREFILLISDLKQIVDHRKTSPIEFSRNDRYIICSEDYRMKSLTIEKLKDYIAKSKTFIGKLNNIFREHDRRIR